MCRTPRCNPAGRSGVGQYLCTPVPSPCCRRCQSEGGTGGRERRHPPGNHPGTHSPPDARAPDCLGTKPGSRGRAGPAAQPPPIIGPDTGRNAEYVYPEVLAIHSRLHAGDSRVPGPSAWSSSGRATGNCRNTPKRSRTGSTRRKITRGISSSETAPCATRTAPGHCPRTYSWNSFSSREKPAPSSQTRNRVRTTSIPSARSPE